MATYAAHSDQELLHLAAQDDEKAYAEIYHRYWEILLKMAYSKLKDLAASEDIVHDIFLSLWSNRKKSAIQSLNNYLLVAVKYSVLNTIRRAGIHAAYEKEIVHAGQTEAIAGESTAVHPSGLSLDEQIERLPEKCKLIFRYRQQGFNNQEIAQVMRIAEKTVKNQLNKGIKLIKRTLHNLLFSLPLFF